MLVSSLVRAFFVPGSCYFRALFVPFSSLVRASFELGLCHFRGWFVPFSSPLCTIFEPAFYPFRARFVPFSSIVHVSLRYSRIVSFVKEITTGYMISYYILLFLSIACERFTVKKRVAECVVVDHQVRVAKLQKIVLFTRSADRKL